MTLPANVAPAKSDDLNTVRAAASWLSPMLSPRSILSYTGTMATQHMVDDYERVALQAGSRSSSCVHIFDITACNNMPPPCASWCLLLWWCWLPAQLAPPHAPADIYFYGGVGLRAQLAHHGVGTCAMLSPLLCHLWTSRPPQPSTPRAVASS